MKIFVNIIKISLLFTFLSPDLFADSPLTSTPFSDVYLEEPIVSLASKSKGILTNELMNYLLADNPLDKKMALINALGWDIEGRKNADTFLHYIFKLKGYSSMTDFLNSGKSDEILSFAYIKALDNYFQVDSAIYYADRALQKNQMSFTCNIITALIKAQKALSQDWCEVYSLTDKVRQNKFLQSDLKQRSVEVIFNYMDNYKEYCK